MLYLQCLNASTILSSHGMFQGVDVTLADFSFLCPALLNQIDGGACILHGGAADDAQTGRSPLAGGIFMYIFSKSTNQEQARKVNGLPKYNQSKEESNRYFVVLLPLSRLVI